MINGVDIRAFVARVWRRYLLRVSGYLNQLAPYICG